MIEDAKLENQSFKEGLYNEAFEQCTFINCDFSNAQIISTHFTDCSFVGCNFSMTNLSQSMLNNISFIDCKILGVKFNLCHDFIFEVSFNNCILDYSSFEKRKMQKTIFHDSSLKSVDFTGSNLKQSTFINSDLQEAIFYNSNIQEVDFTSAFNYTIDLGLNNIKKARFSKDNLSGLLSHYNIIIEE